MDYSTGQLPTRATQALFVLRSADFHSTADQSFTALSLFNLYLVNKVVAVCKTGGVTISCTGGIYTGAGKTGNQLVSALQSWFGLSSGGKLIDSTLASIISTDIQSALPILSLTTGSTTAVTADIFIFGYILD